MSRYTGTKKMFRSMTTADLTNVAIRLMLELQDVVNKGNLLREQIKAAEEVLKERK